MRRIPGRTREGNTHTESYRVYYDYYICTVKLENFDLSHLPVYMMDQETLSMYAVYMSTLGNRPTCSPSSGYVPKYVTNPPAKYEIPVEYLSDERFAALITEAEKYLGFPYVWGGSSPSTSFDCSGFVSYVLTNSGLCDTGRLGAQGLYNISTPVSEPRPGIWCSLWAPTTRRGVSHVGFYVGGQDAPALRRSHPVHQSQLELLAVPLLCLRQTAIQLMEAEPMLTVKPMSLADANRFVAEHHRHHKPVRGHKFSLGCMANGRLAGVAIVGAAGEPIPGRWADPGGQPPLHGRDKKRLQLPLWRGGAGGEGPGLP